MISLVFPGATEISHYKYLFVFVLFHFDSRLICEEKSKILSVKRSVTYKLNFIHSNDSMNNHISP
jgi:hypothetical protein